MSFETGTITDLSDPNSIADPVVLVSAAAVKNPVFLGRFWNDMSEFNEGESNRKFDVHSRSETARDGAVGANWTDGTATTGLILATTVGLIKGLVIQIESEVVVIKSVPSATTINVVARGAAGTTGIAHVDTTAFTVIGSAINDIDLKDIGSVSEISLVFPNFMQTVAEPIDFTKGGQIDARKGLSPNMMSVVQEEAMTRVAKNIFASSINGLKQQKVGDSPFMTAGLIQQLTDTTGGRLVLEASTTGALDEAKLKSALRTVTRTGTPTDIYVSSANKDVINGFNGATSDVSIQTGRTDTQAGFHVATYNYEGLILNVKIDLSLGDDVVAIVNINKCMKGWKTDDNLVYENQPDLSTREKRAAFNGSYGIMIEDVGYEHIIMTGVTIA
jgi:hypothetical protein